VLSDNALSLLVPILEETLGWNALQIRDLLKEKAELKTEVFHSAWPASTPCSPDSDALHRSRSSGSTVQTFQAIRVSTPDLVLTKTAIKAQSQTDLDRT
jgi:hypothetical protein